MIKRNFFIKTFSSNHRRACGTRYFLVGIRTSKNYQHFCHPYGKSEKGSFH